MQHHLVFHPSDQVEIHQSFKSILIACLCTGFGVFIWLLLWHCYNSHKQDESTYRQHEMQTYYGETDLRRSQVKA